ncbi:sporadic carbohydrate cluster 2OG-Fe(II) oxygenase [Azospirillum sp. TSO5]|uniref:sporadic carbohydrate cluster 2OG-Fe(II) oxygenase n=1 Tax=Azospirillum sp. TSO5 TaxID=716760 RepID=UPI0020005226|nr:sporadic carbohydrate cluster 2OG-Fe(II) oxygenase [Azospirillum sp. TSO5]
MTAPDTMDGRGPAAFDVFDGDFLTAEERRLSDRFVDDGYVINVAESRAALDAIRRLVVEQACAWLGCPSPTDEGEFLESIADRVASERLNEFRLAVIAGVNATPWLRAAYFAVARRAIETIVGNELCMQRRINLSIQMPNDTSSILPIHADVWSGDSPFEVVLWIPLVDVRRTKSMFLLPPGPAAALHDRFHAIAGKSAEEIFRLAEPDLLWMELDYGQYMLFNQNLPHGNRNNAEPETRWSMNCRFKGVFTPYADKKLGEFFEPITLRAASRIGMDYELPGGFDE